MPGKIARLLVTVLLASCSPAEEPRPSPERAALEAILEAQRNAHLDLDAGRLVQNIADELVSVDGGAITVQTRAEVREMFAAYFQGARYFVWKDLEPPLIEISEDGSLASVIRRVEVDREEPDGSGGRRRRRFVSAYTSTFRKVDGEWHMTTVTSTFAPTESSARR